MEGSQPESATAPVTSSGLRERVEVALEKVRPALRMDGGDVELVEVSDRTVKLRLVGHCAGCPHARMTLEYGIERALRQEVPEIEAVSAEW